MVLGLWLACMVKATLVGNVPALVITTIPYLICGSQLIKEKLNENTI